jgi:hypothetical protein
VEPPVSVDGSAVADAARAFCSSWRICLRFLFRRGLLGLEGADLKGRGYRECGWPKSRDSMSMEGTGVDVPETLGDGCGGIVGICECAP